MISISPITSAGQAFTYFKRDDYYTRGKEESFSEWHGKGAEGLGLSGAVDREVFKDVLEGRLPTGDTLGRINAAGQKEHKPGYDVSFSAPKSVSVAALVSGDDRLVEAHNDAVKTALDHIERECAVTRVKQGSQTRIEHTGNLAIATFRHETSRMQDPQLHSHCVLMNCTQRSDGQWRSLSERQLFRIHHEADRIYQSELALRARALGYEVEVDREKGRMELAAVPQEVREAFSQRSAAIEANLAENGKSRESASAAEREVACLATRDKKVELDRDSLRREWLSRAQELGYNPERTVAEARARAGESARKPAADRHFAAERAVREAVEHLAERSAAFRAADLDQTLSSKFFGDFSRADLDQAVTRLKEKGELISKEVRSLWDSRNLEPGYTTPQGQKIERQILAAAKRGRGAFEQGITSAEKAREAIAEAHGKWQWNDEQRRAAEGILTSQDRVVSVQGVAGGGKTSTTLRTVGEVAREDGYEVRGLAPSAAAARALEEGAGIESQTLHSFLGELRQAQIQQIKEGQAKEQPQPPGKSLWVVDEAGMVAAKQMRELMHAAETHNARLVLVGDVRQLASVGAGRAFDQLQQQVQTFHIETILRQRDSNLREAVEDAYRGKAAQALEKISERGGVIQIGNPDGSREAGMEARGQAIASAYLALRPGEREGAIVIAPGHDDRAVINGKIREGLISEGAVKQNGFEAPTLERRGLTKPEIKNAQSYHAGEVVRFGRGYANSGIGKGSYWEVADVDGKTVRLSRDGQELEWNPARQSKVEVYRAVGRQLGEGDKIIFSKNDRESGLVNGQTAVVRYLDASTGQTQVITRDGEIREVNLRNNPHWNHGYAVTAHAAQGATADRVFIHAESHRANLTTQRSLYVGISRARDEARVFTDDAAKLREAVELRSGEKEIALEGGPSRADREQDYGLSR